MTNDDRSLERAARTWIEAGPTQAPDRAVDAALIQVQTTPQERDPWIPWRLTSMNRTSQLAAAAAAVVLVVGGGLLLLGRGQSGVGGPFVTPSPSPVAPSPSLIPSAAAATGPIAFESKKFSVPLSLTIMDGWSLSVDAADQVELQRAEVQGGDSDFAIMAMAAVTVPGATAADPYVPFPADITAWLAKRPEFVPFAPREVTVGGRTGTLVEVDFVSAASTSYAIIQIGRAHV